MIDRIRIDIEGDKYLAILKIKFPEVFVLSNEGLFANLELRDPVAASTRTRPIVFEMAVRFPGILVKEIVGKCV